MLFKKKEIEILAPVTGEVMSLENMQDDVFNRGTLGKGIAIIPKENKIYAPVTGIVTSLFPTLHTIGITTKENLELLIHIGINTVNLGGMGFEAKVVEKAGVRAGTLLLMVDINKIKREGYNVITPIVICNPNDFKEIIYRETGKVNKGDVIMKVRL